VSARPTVPTEPSPAPSDRAEAEAGVARPGRWGLSTPLVALDLEFTGLDRARDRICEIGIVRVEGGRVVAERSFLLQPGVPMHPEAVAVTGLTDAMLASAPPLSEVIDEVLALLEGALWIGHRADLDHAWLCAALERLGRAPVPPPTFDTLVMARVLLNLRSHRLGAVCAALGVPQPTAHRALADAQVTWEVFRALVGWYDPDGALDVDGLTAAIDAHRPGSPLRRGILRALQQALAAGQSAWIDYFGRGEGDRVVRVRREVSLRRLDGGKVSAWCHLREAERVFRVDRIARVEVSGRPALARWAATSDPAPG
jgi:DNA polymerase-3 subunit epsilon